MKIKEWTIRVTVNEDGDRTYAEARVTHPDRAAFVGIGYFAAGEATRLQMVVSGAGIATAVVFVALIGAQLALRTLLERAVRRLRPRTLPV